MSDKSLDVVADVAGNGTLDRVLNGHDVPLEIGLLDSH